MKKPAQQKKYSSMVKTDEVVWEMAYDATLRTTAFTGLENGEVISKPSITLHGETIYPYPPENKLVSNKVILFPSISEDYGDEKELLNEIKSFIHKYLEVGEFFEQITPFYVLLTWVYDSFKELPYLRAIGDYGCGKSRFLKVVGSICYKPAFTAGATNPAPIFRIISQFKGTLIIDEADFRFSDTNSEMVKILNNGFQAGMPVLRCSSGDNNFEVEAYDVFGPKVVATRESYEDKALESRFIVEHMDGKLTRNDIPINLDDNFEKEALDIRNKCLMWRLQNYGKKTLDTSFKDMAVEPRLIQVMTPLISVIEDEQVKKSLVNYIKIHNKELVNDRGLSYEAPILRTVIDLVENGGNNITMESIAERFNMGLVKGEKELSGRKVGIIVREKFGFKTDRKNIGYVLDLQNYHGKIDRLKKKYGLDSELVNLVNVVGEGTTEFKEELKSLDIPF